MTKELISRFQVTLAIVLAILLCSTANAQSLGLVPAEIRTSFQPGQSTETELTVSNDGTTEMLMRATVSDFWYDENTNEKRFSPPGTSPRSASSWIEVVPRSFVVPPNGTAKVKVLITPPQDASGGYYSVIFVESKPELAQAETAERRAIYANIRLGTLVLLGANGTEQYGVEVKDAKLIPPTATQDLKIEFQLTNTGNTHLFPQAKLAIINDKKQIAARAQKEPQRFFPGQKDTLSFGWNGTLAPGAYTAILTLLYANKLYTQEFPFVIPDVSARAAEQ
jgi:P pilus assembly chaperone PapD